MYVPLRSVRVRRPTGASPDSQLKVPQKPAPHSLLLPYFRGVRVRSLPLPRSSGVAVQLPGIFPATILLSGRVKQLMHGNGSTNGQGHRIGRPSSLSRRRLSFARRSVEKRGSWITAILSRSSTCHPGGSHLLSPSVALLMRSEQRREENPEEMGHRRDGHAGTRADRSDGASLRNITPAGASPPNSLTLSSLGQCCASGCPQTGGL
jgi:hypothetical protein